MILQMIFIFFFYFYLADTSHRKDYDKANSDRMFWKKSRIKVTRYQLCCHSKGILEAGVKIKVICPYICLELDHEDSWQATFNLMRTRAD